MTASILPAVLFLISLQRDVIDATGPRRITHVPEKLTGKYGVHSEEYVPIRTVSTASTVVPVIKIIVIYERIMNFWKENRSFLRYLPYNFLHHCAVHNLDDELYEVLQMHSTTRPRLFSSNYCKKNEIGCVSETHASMSSDVDATTFVMRRLMSFRFCDMEVTDTKSLVYPHRKKSRVKYGDRGGQSDIEAYYLFAREVASKYGVHSEEYVYTDTYGNAGSGKNVNCLETRTESESPSFTAIQKNR
ncbi:hypothetical protein ANN_09228 [Periplaneta americana]|uniref:Uncharacterized protein n=1 Tax=Periplaneta americana TaxID=6978 RepID=A0ABQ8TPB6_PERAM|nr:hypothetical protein ANN_09228 [Periplaneta americana]